VYELFIRAGFAGSILMKWFVYCVLLTCGLLLNFHQFLVEQYMRFQVRNEHVVISFSTTPHRINEMQTTVDTILKQNAKVDAIYIAIPYVFSRDNTPYIIPDWLQNHPRITVIRTQDYGPATKLLGVLEQINLDNNTIIITMDDDIKYPKSTALHLVYKAKQYPNEAIGIAGGDLDYDDYGNLIPNKIGGLISQTNSDANATLLQGFASIAYRRKFFAADIFEIVNAPRECINSDDFYLSFHLAKYNIPRRILSNRYINKAKINYSNDIGHGDDALHNLIPAPSDKHRICINYMKELAPEVTF
jgi:hypothetical protein